MRFQRTGGEHDFVNIGSGGVHLGWINFLGNRIGDEGAECLAKAFQVNRTLSTFYLGSIYWLDSFFRQSNWTKRSKMHFQSPGLEH
jgi:hypothetical protein